MERMFGLRWIAVALLATVAAVDRAQVSEASDASEKRLAFEVASVRENKSDEKPTSNFPLNLGPQFSPNGGVLSARNMLLLQYMVFALKPSSFQIQAFRAGLPDWARSTHFDIEARAEGNPSKDEMRAMMLSLLEERFGMKVHHEGREVPVFALVLAKPGKLGPALTVHPADDPYCTKAALPVAIAGGYPAACGAGASTAPSVPGSTAIAGRKVTMASFVLGLTNLANGVDRPVIDQTGLNGVYDYRLEWAPDVNGEGPAADAMEPGFFAALREQMGLKLVAQKGMVDVIVLDRVDRPAAN